MMIEIQSQVATALHDSAIAGPVIGMAAGSGTRSALDDLRPVPGALSPADASGLGGTATT